MSVPSVPLAARLQRALSLYQQGRLSDAEAACQAVLDDHPGQFDALHLLGMIALRYGQTQGQMHAQAQAQTQRGIDLITQALQHNPTSALAYSNLGHAYQGLSNYLEAIACFDQALALDPNYMVAHFNRASSLSGMKRYEEAVAGYERVIELAPGTIEAWSNLGNALRELKRYDAARASYERALVLSPGYAHALSNLGNLLCDLGLYHEAVLNYDRALASWPNSAESHSNRGNALRELKRFDESIASFERALALKPDFSEALSNLGNALRDAGRREDALVSYDRALALKPDYPSALANRGNVLRELRRFDEALSDFERGLALEPQSAVLLSSRGDAFFGLQRFGEALADYDAALAIDPEHFLARSNRGSALRELRRFDESLVAVDQALLLQPDSAEILTNRGDTLCELSRFEEALSAYDRALVISPSHAGGLSNRGNALRALKRYDEALATYAAALETGFELAATHMNESLCRLLIGDLELGWQKYEWRFETENMLQHVRVFEQPRWQGQPLTGKRILLYAEQGFGDTIQFCRYARLVAERGAHVILEVPPALKSLLGQLTGVAQVLSQGDVLPEFDYQCPMLSLPLVCATTLTNIPAAPSYIQAEQARIPQWQARLSVSSRLRVGLAWSGNPQHRNNHNRSLLPAILNPLMDVPVQYVSVQREHAAADTAWLAQHGIAHFGEQLRDFADTAALLSCMDLVITVDTAIAHLAGALGKPVWILLPYDPDWRWLTERDDSPWYPSAQLFRQTARGDWGRVIERVVERLRNRLG
ncbi:tetratricopeptide repeat protein [Burkholderia sp. L27(2015)]|uniref:tetratricopeptide repeat protein n=1 Tax=Burkholderia sp. L27(2015) TaxID=1641858 RepID=UPI00131C7CAB|nr:tetratricopeptide repeat protein [Burkholderia sp. L27(2015)]